MQVCKNNRSGQYFIYIHKTGREETLLITPETKLKSLDLNLFQEVEEKDEDYLQSSELITVEQIQRYYDYRQNRTDEEDDKNEEFIEELLKRPSHELEAFIEKLKRRIEPERKEAKDELNHE